MRSYSHFLKKRLNFRAVLVVAVIAVIGAYFLLSSHAATPYASNEAESGTLSGAATEGSDSNASGGKYVQFGSTQSTGYTGTCTKTINTSTVFATAVDSMSAGQTLCLNSGTYGSISSDNETHAAGSAGSPITITSAPGQTATVDGAFYLEGGYLTIEHLNLDGTDTLGTGYGGANPQSSGCTLPDSIGIDIDASNDTLQDNNIYESNSSQTIRDVLIGIGYFSQVNNTVIRNNKISDGGGCGQTEHLIYDDKSSNAQIYQNWLWGDPYGYAVQLYPSPGTSKVYSNVFDGTLNGVVDATSVGGNQTYNNVAINSVTSNSDGFTGGSFLDCFQGSTGTTDIVENNAMWNEAEGFDNNCTSESNVTTSGNITLPANPFVDSATHNYNLGTNSSATQISGYGLWNGVGPPTPDPAP
jgi:hypothetical protein